MPLKIALESNELLSFLKMDPGFDDNTINTMFDSAKLEAEMFLNTDFSTVVTNDDGTTTITPNDAPATVKEWIFNRVAQKYENVGSFVNPDYSALQPYRVYPFRGM
jgi:hypothetical protein